MSTFDDDDQNQDDIVVGALRARLDDLRQQHRDLDARIGMLSEDVLSDQITLRRLKKQKLWLKDQISRIEDQLYPDIIA